MSTSKEEILARVEKAIVEGNKDEAEALAKEAIMQRLDLNEVIDKGYVSRIQKVGDLWEKGEYFLPELITSAECMKGAMSVLQPEIEKAEAENADFICFSALLTTTMLGQKKVIEILREKNLGSRYKVLVGGAPVNQKWADDIGANGYGENAMIAVKIAKKIIGE